MAPDAASTPTTPAPRKRRWRRRLGWTFAILLILLLLAPLAIGLGPVRSLIADKIGSALDRRVEIGSASGYWFKGIDLEDLTVHSPEGFDGPLATVARVHADVDVLGLIGGTVGARVRVVQPHVMLRRNAAGESNAKDLGGAPAPAGAPEPTPSEAPAEEAGAFDVEIILVAGTVEALDASGKAENALRDIQFSASMKPDGAADIDLQALAEAAGAGGKDARLKLLVTRDAAQAGRFEVEVPPLQLSRLARMAEDTIGVTNLRGTVELHGKGTLHSDDTIAGTLSTHFDAVSARTPDGTDLTVQRIMGSAKLRSVNQTTEADIGIGMGNVGVSRRVEGRVESFREPDITLQASATYNPKDGLLQVARGSLQGGHLMQVLVKEPLRIERDAGGRFAGRLDARVSLGRLGSLRGLFPALQPLAAGTLDVRLAGGGAESRDVAAGITITDLALRPSDLAPDGYSEPRIVAQFRLGSTEDGGRRFQLTQLGAQIIRLTTKDAARGVTLTLAPDGAYAVDGDFTLGVGLQSLSRLMGPKLGLKPGERLAGTLQLVGSGSGTPDEMRLSMDLHGTRIGFPPSWGTSSTPGALSAKVLSTRKNGEAVVTISELSGMGLNGSAKARLREQAERGETATVFKDAELQLLVDLARARPWVGGLLGLAPTGEVRGRVRSDLRIVAEPGGQHLVGTTQINDLYLRARPALVPIEEKRVTLRSDVRLAEAGGRHQARELKLEAAGVQLDLSGSTFVAEPDVDVDLKAVLGGDAALLAPTLAALLGEGYEDLRGEGRLTGSLRLTGSPSDHARALFSKADLALGSWTTSGLKVESVKVRTDRADASAPLTLEVKAGLNGGSALVTGEATLGAARIPWKSSVKLAGVDTSGLLVSQGLGRYLTFVLPALLPAKASAAVLSGRLDADLQGSSTALRGEPMKAALRGTGRIAMEQGQIKQSTLFGGGGDSQLGKLIAVLRGVAPEVGIVLSELQKAINFNSLVSEFDVANQVVTVKQTKLTGQRVVIDMQGRVLFAGPIDLTSRATLQGNTGKRLAKVIGQDALPLRVRGTLEEPQVQPDVDLTKLLLPGGKGKDDLLDKIRKKLPKPPKLPKLPNPFK